MAVKAYVLIRVRPGSSDAVIRGLQHVSSVRTADLVTGPYDIVAAAEVDNIEGLGPLVVDPIQIIRGVTHTETCVRL